MTEIIRWPDDSTQPLTPELAEALRIVVEVFGPECRVIGARPARKREEARAYWQKANPRGSLCLGQNHGHGAQ